jgi:hypothetical protein
MQNLRWAHYKSMSQFAFAFLCAAAKTDTQFNYFNRGMDTGWLFMDVKPVY